MLPRRVVVVVSAPSWEYFIGAWLILIALNDGQIKIQESFWATLSLSTQPQLYVGGDDKKGVSMVGRK